MYIPIKQPEHWFHIPGKRTASQRNNTQLILLIQWKVCLSVCRKGSLKWYQLERPNFE